MARPAARPRLARLVASRGGLYPADEQAANSLAGRIKP